jgi:hypothetical protein
MPTLFKSLAELLEKVEATKKRLEITGMTAGFLRQLDTENADTIEKVRKIYERQVVKKGKYKAH